jgi:hypothetical protein
VFTSKKEQGLKKGIPRATENSTTVRKDLTLRGWAERVTSRITCRAKSRLQKNEICPALDETKNVSEKSNICASLRRRKETAAPEEIKKKRIWTGDMKSCLVRFARRTKTASTREEQTSKQSRLSANETALGSGVFQCTTKAGTRVE